MPDLIEIMGKVCDYPKLLYVWKAWRDATGAKMKQLFCKYVQLSNKAAQANGKFKTVSKDVIAELGKNLSR